MLQAQNILDGVKQDSNAARFALEYAKPMAAALVFTGLFDLQRRFLAAMGHPTGPMIC